MNDEQAFEVTCALNDLVRDLHTECERVRRETTHDGPPFDVIDALEWFRVRTADIVKSAEDGMSIPKRPAPNLQGAGTHPIPEAQIANAVSWWALRFLVGESRERFRESLTKVLRDQVIGPRAVNLVVDYDPRGILLDSVRAAGVQCSGAFDSARGIFRSQKMGMSIREGYTVARDGREAPRVTIWGTNPND